MNFRFIQRSRIRFRIYNRLIKKEKVKQNNLHNTEEGLNNEWDIVSLIQLISKEEAGIFNTIYRIFRSISKNWDTIFLSFLLRISKEENINEYNKFLNNKWFWKKYLDTTIKLVKDNIEKVLENKKYRTNEKKKNNDKKDILNNDITTKILNDLLLEIHDIKITSSEFLKKYFKWKWNFTNITISIYRFLIEKIEFGHDLEDIYNFYEKIREIKIKEKVNRDKIKNEKEIFFKVYWEKRKNN
jgi:hypothetical protein